MRRKLLILGAALMAVFLVASVAFAQEDSLAPEHGDRPGKTITASGDGTADLAVDRGGLRIWLVGDITIEGPAELDVEIDSFGSALALPESDGTTSISLTGFSGSVFVRGLDYTVSIDGHMTFHGHGSGEASLDGTGLWKTRTDKGVWPADLGFDS